MVRVSVAGSRFGAMSSTTVSVTGTAVGLAWTSSGASSGISGSSVTRGVGVAVGRAWSGGSNSPVGVAVGWAVICTPWAAPMVSSTGARNSRVNPSRNRNG